MWYGVPRGTSTMMGESLRTGHLVATRLLVGGYRRDSLYASRGHKGYIKR